METPVASILWFVFILALIPVALWALKRLPVVKASQNAPTRVVGVMALSGSRRGLVLGVTPSNITLLHSMAPQAEAAAPAAGSPASFAETLKRLRHPQQGQP